MVSYLPAAVSSLITQTSSACCLHFLTIHLKDSQSNGYSKSSILPAGMVSYLPAAVPEVYSIKEGNQQLAVKLLNASHPEALHLPVQMTQLEQQDDGTWAVYTAPPPPVAGAAADVAGNNLENQEASEIQGKVQ